MEPPPEGDDALERAAGDLDLGVQPANGSIHVLADDGHNSLHIGDHDGVFEVWREAD
jgi:hypothetical protein